jgi:hypothetical protein
MHQDSMQYAVKFMWCGGITWFTSCLDSLHGLLHPALIHYMTDYILPGFITWIITSCFLPLHAPSWLHAPLHAPESITCSRIHYIHYMPVLPNPLHAASVHRCPSIGSGPGHRQRLSDHCVAQLARLARAVNSLSSAEFNLQDNIPACSDQTYSIQMRWLPARGPCKIEVEQCRWWLRQVVLGISRMSMLNIHAILPRTKI